MPETKYENLKGSELSKLIKEVACGDVSSLEKLYNHTSYAVFGYALSILKNYAMAEDVMQDVYVKIFEKANTYKRENNAMAWMLTITRNLCLMQFRKKENNNSSIDEFYNLETNQDDFEKLENNLLIAKLFKILTKEEVEIVVMHALWGLKHKEIAKILKLPLSTTLSKYNRSVAKMKQQKEVFEDER